MHWTLASLIALCLACLAGNAWRMRETGTVATTGLLICNAWAIQQTVWLVSGSDSQVLFLLCDAAIIYAALKARHWTDWGIVLLMPVCWACQTLDYTWGPTRAVWWTNWIAVTAQMVLGLPWLSRQGIGPMVSHGPLRGAI